MAKAWCLCELVKSRRPRSSTQHQGMRCAETLLLPRCPEGLSLPGSSGWVSDSIPATHVLASPVHVPCPGLNRWLG